MKTEINPKDVVGALLRLDSDVEAASMEIAREEQSGDEAVVAVVFRTSKGTLRRGFLSLRRHGDGAWRPSGGWSGGVGAEEPAAVFATCGEWGGTDKHAVLGGWVADTSAVSARLVDPTTGQVLTDQVKNEVVIFMAASETPLRHAQVELLDRNQSVLRTAPARRTTRR